MVDSDEETADVTVTVTVESNDINWVVLLLPYKHTHRHIPHQVFSMVRMYCMQYSLGGCSP